MPIASLVLVGVLLGASDGGLDKQSATYPRFAHVRAVDSTCAVLARRGSDASPTFRRLVANIENSDIIVYVKCGSRLRRGVAGVTRLAVRAGGYRYVHVAISEGLEGDEAVAVLGHELFHVTELATARQIVDDAGVRELYMTLGHRTCAGEPPCFDTLGARHAGDRILRELRALQPGD